MWEIYALRYATMAARKASDNFINPPDLHDAPMPIDYFIWLLRDGDRTIVVDTGFSAETAAARGRSILRPVGDVLATMGVVAAEVNDVIVTHLHYDHAGNLPLFGKAHLHLQEREMAFATGRNMCFGCIRHAFEAEDVVAMVRALYAGRVTFHDGEGEIAPGVSVHRVGGHTDGLQMVRIETARGPVVLASDAAHFYANLLLELPFPIVFDLGAMAQGWRAARRLAGGDETRVVPGHDPAVLTRYPRWQENPEIVALHLAPV
jgi:glyoxylase-like metal-dependent hydrolase (beta-lactamase superfamily II)